MIRFLANKVNHTVEVKLMGDLDIDSTEVIEVELMPTIEPFESVDLNFEGVPFIDSSGIGLLLNAVQTLNSQGTKVTITNVREEVMDIFELLQIPDILGEGVF
ncbi:STAS domain-containing protein [Alkalihalobacillus deserti]|uniref:STAS domain-containing protein n=1 Tax=Alkalihalobacillus deserti TaxID=2879466 RepID=UPI001D144951|nr:STAS domain-containing protein [Alkalihalobacillus deserti]